MKGSWCQAALRRVVERRNGHGSYANWYPLAWNVKVDMYPTFEQAFLCMAKENFKTPADAVLRLRGWREMRDKWDIFLEWGADLALEDMRRSFQGPDDWVRTVRPEIAQKYGLPNSFMADVTYEFIGRSGGWLVIDTFGDLAFCREHKIPQIPNYRARELAALIEELDLLVEHRNEEFVHHMGCYMYNELIGETHGSGIAATS